MDWSDRGLVLARRRHGESAGIVTLFTRAHGRHLGLVRALGGKRGSRTEPGTLVEAQWRARLDAHLGTWSCEAVAALAAPLLDDPARLAALSAALAIVERALPEREPHPALFDATLALLAGLAESGWPARYVRWECACLAELGYGLALDRCAVSGIADGLTHVSPRTGRAVAAAHAAAYRDRLLKLPAFLAGGDDAPSPADLADGLALTGHFLERQVFVPLGRDLPAARTRLLERLRRMARVRPPRI